MSVDGAAEPSGWLTVDVGAAAIAALAGDWASRDRLRELALGGQGEPAAIRRAALLALGGSPADLPLLRHGAGAAEAEVRAAALAGLAADPLARELAAERLERDPSCAARAAAVAALAGEPARRPLLLGALAAPLPRPDQDPAAPALEAALVRALAGEPDALSPLLDRVAELSFDARAALLDALWARPEHRPGVRALLGHASPLVRAAAARALRRDPVAAPALRALAEDASPVARAASLAALARDPAAAALRARKLEDAGEDASVRVAILESLSAGEEDPARRLLSDPAPALRGVAASALRGDAASIPARLALLQDASPLVRARAVESLAPERAHHPALLASLDDADPWVRAAAIAALRRDPAAIPRIRRRVDDPPPAGPAAMQALREDPASLPLLRARLYPRSIAAAAPAPAADAAAAPSREAIEAAVSELEEPSVMDGDPVQLAAVRVIAGLPEHADRLRAIVESGAYSAEVTRAALESLPAGALAPGALLELVGDAQELASLRIPAARHLAAMGGHAEELRALLADPSPALRAAIIELLGDDAGLAGLLPARLRDLDPRVRIAAAAALRRRRAPDRGDSLLELAERMGVAAGGRLGAPPVPALGPVDLDAHPRRDAALAWLCARLCSDERGKAIARGAEVEPSPAPWGEREVYVVRLPFDEAEAPRAAGVLPAHALIEAAAWAARLFAASAPSFWLVCADAAFADLAPPALLPGASLHGPAFFGFRLRAGAPG